MPNINDAVIVRARDAGVHFGYLKSYSGREVTLTNSRRIWRWFGANTLSEVAMIGIDQSKSRIAVKVDEITILDACEIIACSPEGTASIEGATWVK